MGPYTWEKHFYNTCMYLFIFVNLFIVHFVHGKFMSKTNSSCLKWYSISYMLVIFSHLKPGKWFVYIYKILNIFLSGLEKEKKWFNLCSCFDLKVTHHDFLHLQPRKHEMPFSASFWKDELIRFCSPGDVGRGYYYNITYSPLICKFPPTAPPLCFLKWWKLDQSMQTVLSLAALTSTELHLESQPQRRQESCGFIELFTGYYAAATHI